MRQARCIIIDTRERRPYALRGYRARRACLDVGDYSVSGLEGEVAVERKSPSDFVNTMLTNYDRFERALERAKGMGTFAVVVECSMAAVMLEVSAHSRAQPRAVLARAAVLSSRHRVPILFCDNRGLAEAITLEILRPHL